MSVPVPDDVWLDRLAAARDQLLPWIDKSFALADANVLEYGCGNGAVSCAVADKARTLVGFDIDADAVAFGKVQAGERGLSNVRLEAHAVDRILAAVAEHTGEIDVFLLYAVLEHMSVAERLEVLRLARTVVRPGGVIVVCETPNRLVYGDPHSSQLPFFAQLPDELALAYYTHSTRTVFLEQIGSVMEAPYETAREALTRFGRAVSYHEFEVALGDLRHRVLASNYDPMLFARRPIMADELLLAGWLARERPDLAPAWSRYWIDVILAPEPIVEEPKFIWPWTMETVGASHAYFTRWESVVFEEGGTLPVVLPRPTQRLVIVLQAEEGDVDVEIGGPQLSYVVKRTVPGPAVHQRHTTIDLPSAVTALTLRLKDPAYLVFLGYEA